MLPSIPLIARGLATKAPKAPEAPKGAESKTSSTPEAEQPEESTTPTPDDASPSVEPALEERSVEELQALIGEKNEALGECKAQVEELTDKLKRSLADMENLRYRTARDLESTKKFAAQGIVKSMLDVADNLQRAAESVPAEALQGDLPEGADRGEEHEKALQLLKSLHVGVLMTDKVLQQVFKQHGVSAFDPVGEKFNPNDHNALFEVPDGSREPGVVAVVTKRGYKMHDRVVRPADVGVSRAP